MKRTILGLLALALLASLLLLLPMAAQATVPDTETCPNDPSGGTHDYVVTFEEPNCQHGLIERGTCSKCGKTYEFDYGQKGDHAFGDYETFDPTCTEYGGTRRVCSVCGYVEELLEIEPLGHEEVGVPAKETTCTETGLTEGSKCSRCGIALTPQQTIPALGHDPVIVQGYGATCTAAGLTEGSKCSRCGTILTAQTEIPPLGHEFLKYSDKDATCTQAGERIWYCSRCTETKTEALPALGHAWGSWAQVSAATCTAEGSQTRTCSRCGAQETQAIAALGHSAQAVAGYAAACTAAGLTDGSKCSRCGETLTAQAAIPALGHDYKLTASKEPTATEDGYKTYTCSRCQDTYTDVIPKVAHEHAYSVTAETPATCTASGSKTYTCSICGVAYSDTVPATGHNWSVWYTAQEATATQDGWMQRTCQNDPSHVEYQVIPATGEENVTPDPGQSQLTVELIEDGYGIHRINDGREDYQLGDYWDAWCAVHNVGPVDIAAYTLHIDYMASQYHIVDSMNGDGSTWFEIYPSLYTDETIHAGENHALGQRIDGSISPEDAARGYIYVRAYVAWVDPETGADRISYSDPMILPVNSQTGLNPSLDIIWKNDEITIDGFPHQTTNPDVLKAKNGAAVYYNIINTGDVTLNIQRHAEFGNGYSLSLDQFIGDMDPCEICEDADGISWNIGDYITPGTETEELLGTATLTYWVTGHDPVTGVQLCESKKLSRTWQVGKDGSITPDPGESQLSVKLYQDFFGIHYHTGREDYQLGDHWDAFFKVRNDGPVEINEYTLHVDYAASPDKFPSEHFTNGDGATWFEIYVDRIIEAGGENNLGRAHYLDTLTWGCITPEDVARGYIYVRAYVTWVDPETGADRIAFSNTVILPVSSKTGLVLTKGIDHGPQNGSFFEEGEEIPWTLTVTNNSEEPITNVSVTDEGVVVGTFAEIAAGDTVSCAVPSHTVTEYEAIVGTVTNIATAVGTDLKGVKHTYMSNSVSVPTNDHSPTPLPPTGDPDTGGGGITEEPVPPVIPETPTTPDTPEGHFDPSMLPTGIPALEPVLGPDGMPILGPDGTPFLAPPGTTVVLDGDGNVLLSPFGTPVMMLPDGTYFTIGPDGRPILTDKDGNPILDANGNYIYIDFDTLYSCALNLEALGGAEAQYTLHACMDHKAAAEAAEAALNAGNGAEACRIWKEAIEELYGILYEAGDDGAKAALTEEKAAFEAFADSYAALAGSKAAAEMWRMKCARLCSIVHTLPENLPESLAGEYATILGGGRSYDETARVIGALLGYDSSMAEEYGPAEAETLQNVKEMLNIVSSWNYDSAFERGQQLWTMTLDRRVNAVYKAADPETRTKIAAWRVALDALAAAETTLSGMLYPDDAAIPAEIVMNLFKDSVFDSVKLLNGEDEPADEGAKVKEFVARCYRYALGREGSEGEIASWAAMVTDGGRRVEDIARDILGSAEFRSRNLNNEEIVKALYLIYFNREADAGGLATWVGVLDRGEGIETVEAGLAGSDEFKSVMGE